MYLSISLDRTPTGLGGETAGEYRARAARIQELAPDMVLLAGDDGQRIVPPAIEGLLNIAWITATLTTPVVVAGLPGIHSLPFHIARALSAADFLSGGRTGFMPILGDAALRDPAYGTEFAKNPDEACARADDFILATRALWDSWDDDAILFDKENGQYLDSSKVRRVNYRGPFFKTMGPLNAARPPQGYPLLVRDIADRPTTKVAEDVVIGNEAQLATVPAGPVRFLRTTSNPQEAAEKVKAGLADGLHLAGPDALAMLAELRKGAPAPVAMSGRRRFNLPHPVNPFTRSVA